MNKIYFTSDLHFGHKNIIEYDQRPFKGVEEMDKELIKRWNNKVDSKDVVYILGDISWHKDNKTLEIYNQLNGVKRLIKGNHDKLNGSIRSCFESVKDYSEITINDMKLILSHYPIHFYNHHHHGAIMLYGHVHNSREDDCVQEIRYNLIGEGIPCEMYNVGTMMWNYEPVTLEEILSK